MSLSARALAGSLSAAGLSVAAIDLFCDQDLDQPCQKVSVFDQEKILHAINLINEKTPCNYLIVGGGIESCSELLDQLPDNMTLLGNFPDVFQSTNNPETFFNLLEQLNIPHSKTVFEPPAASKNWLVKQAGSCGGSGVSRFEPDQTYSPSSYYQQYIQGQVCSVVFVAVSQAAKVIGYNEIWHEGDKSFMFSGAISLPDFPENQQKIIHDHLQLLTIELGLVGLCGMDFIIDDQDKIHVLEINPRPTATFELHDQNNDLILQHINACRYGKLLSDRKTITGNMNIKRTYAKQIFYAEKTLIIDQKIRWPEWTADRPNTDQIIEAHEPVCTAYADGSRAGETEELLRERMLQVEKLLS